MTIRLKPNTAYSISGVTGSAFFRHPLPYLTLSVASYVLVR